MQEVKRYIPYIIFWLANSTIFYLSSLILPRNFELGSATIPENLAFLWVGAWLTFIVWFSKPVITQIGLKLEGEAQNFIFYWASNSITIWILARVAEFSGFGISRFFWAIILGLVMNTIQWGLWQILKNYKLA